MEHVVPRSKGGTDRVSNLTISCRKCNLKKGNRQAEDFVKDDSKLRRILSRCKSPLIDAAAMNSTKKEIGRQLQGLGRPVSSWSGGMTKFNRISQGYGKDHWMDAACVGESGRKVRIPGRLIPMEVRTEGRGSRQMCRVDRFGFPRTGPKKAKRVQGFQAGDIVRAVVPKGKRAGRYFGRVAVRACGNFNVKTRNKVVQGINYKSMSLVQRVDGYSYAQERRRSFI